MADDPVKPIDQEEVPVTQPANAQKNSDGTYSVRIQHSISGAVSEVHFPNVVFAETMAHSYAAFINGITKVGAFVEEASPSVKTDAQKVSAAVKNDTEQIIEKAKIEAAKLKADAEDFYAKAKVHADTLIVEAKATCAKLIADAKTEIAKFNKKAPAPPPVKPPDKDAGEEL